MMKAKIVLFLVILGCSQLVIAESADSTKLRPQFALEYTGELQTDFKATKLVNLLQLRTELPLSKSLSFQAASLSVVSTQNDLLFVNMMGYSNIDAYNKAFALMVAGFKWHINNRHTLFAGVRRMDEDYFCSDGSHSIPTLRVASFLPSAVTILLPLIRLPLWAYTMPIKRIVYVCRLPSITVPPVRI